VDRYLMLGAGCSQPERARPMPMLSTKLMTFSPAGRLFHRAPRRPQPWLPRGHLTCLSHHLSRDRLFRLGWSGGRG
jgi:hypothetical protein